MVRKLPRDLMSLENLKAGVWQLRTSTRQNYLIQTDTMPRSSDSVDIFVVVIDDLYGITFHCSLFHWKQQHAKLGQSAHHQRSRGQPSAPWSSPVVSDELDMKNCRLYMRVVFAGWRCFGMTSTEARLPKQMVVYSLVQQDPLRAHIVASALRWGDPVKSAALNALSHLLWDMVGLHGRMRGSTSECFAKK